MVTWLQRLYLIILISFLFPRNNFSFFHFNDKSLQVSRAKLSQLHLLSKDPTRFYNEEVLHTGAEKAVQIKKGFGFQKAENLCGSKVFPLCWLWNWGSLLTGAKVMTVTRCWTFSAPLFFLISYTHFILTRKVSFRVFLHLLIWNMKSVYCLLKITAACSVERCSC